MDDFVAFEAIKALYQKAEYINLSTVGGEGNVPHPSNVRIVHGHGLSLYFLAEATSKKSQDIQVNQHIGGSLLIETPKPGAGVNLYFNGIAHMLSANKKTPSLLPPHSNEREGMIRNLSQNRADYNDNVDEIILEQTDLRLHRVVLTKAWYNGGIYKKDSSVEANATQTIKIVSDKSCPLIRRYMVDGRQPTPEYAINLNSSVIEGALGVAQRLKLVA